MYVTNKSALCRGVTFFSSPFFFGSTDSLSGSPVYGRATRYDLSHQSPHWCLSVYAGC